MYIKYKFYEATANIFFISMISNQIISNIYNFAELIRKAPEKIKKIMSLRIFGEEIRYNLRLKC